MKQPRITSIILLLLFSIFSVEAETKKVVPKNVALVTKKRKLALQKIMIEIVEFEDAEISEVLEFLKKKITEKDPQFNPNFVIQDPEKKFHGKRINLQLKNIPASVILDNIATMADGKVKHGEYTIVIQPK